MKKIILLVVSLFLIGCTATETKTVCTLQNSFGELETLEYIHKGDELIKLAQKAEAPYSVLGIDDAQAQAYVEAFNANTMNNLTIPQGLAIRMEKTDTTIIIYQDYDFSVFDKNLLADYLVDKNGEKYLSFGRFNEEDKKNGYRCK